MRMLWELIRQWRMPSGEVRSGLDLLELVQRGRLEAEFHTANGPALAQAHAGWRHCLLAMSRQITKAPTNADSVGRETTGDEL